MIGSGLAFAPALAADDSGPDKVAVLIEQLGDARFARREAAGRELVAVGEPALAALREAAVSSTDPEIRRRAGQVVREIVAGLARKELAKWEGTWKGPADEKLTFAGGRWSSGTPTFGPVSGSVQVVEVRERFTLVDLVVEDGPTKGGTVQAIIRLDGDSLHYCGTYTAPRPTEFKTEGTNLTYSLTRMKK